jgi:uncharacterized coiled-coil DUF342 family protein
MDNDRNVSELKNELNSLDKTKEEFFKLSKENREKLFEIRKKVQGLKNERNQLTDSVKKIKVERDELNKQLKDKIQAFKKIAPKKQEKPKERVNTSYLKKEIKEMEYKIETEGLDFDKEQKLMKVIKEKKKQIEGAEFGGMSKEARELSKEIDAIRAKADTVHKSMQEKANLSQKKHEEVIKLSNELKEIENKQKELDNKCREYKDKVRQVNENLKSKLDQIVAERKQPVHQEKHKQEKRHEKRRNTNVEEMQRRVEEKIKKGEKLTTEDLIAYQAKR